MSWTYEATRNGYAKLWDSIKIKSSDLGKANKFARLIIENKDKYVAVENATGVPWYFVGALHMRESSCNFAGCLHNGEKIIGTRKKTKLVPKGRGPFASWQAAAIDALTMKNLSGIEWCPARIAYQAEIYNGLGYTKKGVNSPYVWAGSNHEQTGKYVADGQFDRSADDVQIGVMTVLKALAQLDPEVSKSLNDNHVKAPSSKGKVIAGAVVGGGAVVAGSSDAVPDASSTLDQLSPIIGVFQSYGTTIAVAFTIAIAVGAVAWHFYQKKQALDAAD